MRKIIISAAMFILSAPACAAPDLFNYGDFFHSLRAGYSVNQHGQASQIYYTALQRFHTGAGADIVSLNVGYESAARRPAVTAGIRLDNILPMMWGGEWGRAHVTTAKLPTFEFGPYMSAWPKSSENLWKLEIFYGLSLAIGF